MTKNENSKLSLIILYDFSLDDYMNLLDEVELNDMTFWNYIILKKRLSNDSIKKYLNDKNNIFLLDMYKLYMDNNLSDEEKRNIINRLSNNLPKVKELDQTFYINILIPLIINFFDQNPSNISSNVSYKDLNNFSKKENKSLE